MKDPPRLPWPLTLASLVAILALGESAGVWPVALALGAALLAHRFVDARLPERAWAVHGARVVLFSAVLLLPRLQDYPHDPRLFGKLLDIEGELCAAEIVLQAWRRPPRAGAARRGAAVVLLSVVVLLAACNIGQSAPWPHVVAPAYFILLIPSLRGLKERGAWTRRHGVAWIAGSWLALVAGMWTCFEIWDHRADLVSLDARFFSYFLDARVGMPDEPRLGRGPGAHGGLERVLRVDGDLPDPHLRGVAFDRYSRGVWGPSMRERRLVTATKEWLRDGAPGPWTRVTRLLGPTTAAYLPLHCAGVRADTAVTRDVLAGARVLVEGQPPVSWSFAAPPSALHPGPLCAPPDADERTRCLAVPAEVSPGVRRLARRIGASCRTDAERVRAVEGYLLANHRYSLSYDPPPGDPVSVFLERKAAAHCEYFGSAAVILLRCLGVPARFVAGYYCWEDAAGGGKVAREQDAHAWAEAWTDGRAWMTVEATPADGLPSQTEERPSALRRMWERAGDAWKAAIAWIAGLDLWGALALVASAAASVVLLVSAWRRLRRRKRRRALAVRFTSPPEFDPIVARFERHLARRGIACPAGRTWGEVVRAGAERRFVERYNSARFGAGEDGVAVKSLDAELRRLEGRA